MDEINIGTYNCQGFGLSKYAFIKGLMRKSNFVFLQEHWLHTTDMQSLCNSGADVSFHGCSSMSGMFCCRAVLMAGFQFCGTLNLIILLGHVSSLVHVVMLCRLILIH